MTVARRAFTSTMTASTGDEIIIPRLRQILSAPQYASFPVRMPPMNHREPDGWFHPSTHPTWGERQLLYYLRSSEEGAAELESEEIDYIGSIAISQGHWLHGYLQHIMLLAGLLMIADPKGHDAADKVEWPVVDTELMSRGHMDGMFDIDVCRLKVPTGLEIKSMNGFKLAKAPRGPAKDPAKLLWLVDVNPGYYLQAQEYMRLSGHREQRMLFVAPSYPFDMVEIAVPYDEETAMATASKYASVLAHYRAGTLPDPCCGVKSARSTSCMARGVCPIARMGR